MFLGGHRGGNILGAYVVERVKEVAAHKAHGRNVIIKVPQSVPSFGSYSP